jgi:K+-transporting ATPase ATPase C chain
MIRYLRASLGMVAIWTALTGLGYPLLVTGLCAVFFPVRSSGSLITAGGAPVGSALVGQPFDDPGYFWGRPSATSPEYDAAASAGSNWGPLNADLHARIAARAAALGPGGPIPVDLVTASGSGLDPHVTPAGAYRQVARVAAARGLDESVVGGLVERLREGRQLGLLGEPRVNILELNLALDRLSSDARRPARP